MADCMLDCLKEARLDKYYNNFIQQGLTTCESLLALSMQDYSRCGVSAMQDRLRLFKLIEIIRSVRAEGIFCHHGQLPSRQPIHEPVTQVQPLEKFTMGSHAPTRIATNSNQPIKMQIGSGMLASAVPQKPINQQMNHLMHEKATTQDKSNVNQPIFRQKPLFDLKKVKQKSPEVVYKKGSDSPIFKCRKTLQFTDSDLESDDEDAAKVIVCPQQNGVQSRCDVGSVSSEIGPVDIQQKIKYGKDLSMESDYTQAPKKRSNAPHRLTTSPQAFFVEVGSSQEQANKSSDVSRNSLRPTIFRTLPTSPLKQPPMVQKPLQSEDHAYFPSVEESRPLYVENIYHGKGYDYGIPVKCDAGSQGNSVCPAQSPSRERIRVCVRKRPLSAIESKRHEVDVVKVQDSSTVVVKEGKLALDLSKFIHKHNFHFDEVFGASCSNQDVYEKSVKPLLKGVLSGGYATCFAFGQTGAGKTYTLLGTRTVPGLYRLAARDIFDHLDRGVRMWISYYEIYCGQLYDLLAKRKKLQVRESNVKKVCITGLMETQVRDVRELFQVIQYGNSLRSTGSTGVNLQSSRSHAVLQIELRDSGDRKAGRLSFIDLAGSERASDVTDFNRQTRIEGAEINQSLLALKECIRSIDQDSSHTPYRQSKLTHILRDSFTGNAQTVMIAAISPAMSACENTLNTLRYADRVKSLKQGTLDHSSLNTSTRTTPGPRAKITPIQATELIHSPLKTPGKGKANPTLFHPSNIPCASTPKGKEVGGGTRATVGIGGEGGGPAVGASPGERQASGGALLDLSKILGDDDESPISGHHVNRSDEPEEVVSGSKENVVIKELVDRQQEDKVLLDDNNNRSPMLIVARDVVVSDNRSRTGSDIGGGRASGSSSANTSGRSHSDMIKEHHDIMSHLDQVLDRAKAVVRRTTPGNSFEDGSNTARSWQGGEGASRRNTEESLARPASYNESGASRRDTEESLARPASYNESGASRRDTEESVARPASHNEGVALYASEKSRHSYPNGEESRQSRDEPLRQERRPSSSQLQMYSRTNSQTSLDASGKSGVNNRHGNFAHGFNGHISRSSSSSESLKLSSKDIVIESSDKDSVHASSDTLGMGYKGTSAVFNGEVQVLHSGSAALSSSGGNAAKVATNGLPDTHISMGAHGSQISQDVAVSMVTTRKDEAGLPVRGDFMRSLGEMQLARELLMARVEAAEGKMAAVKPVPRAEADPQVRQVEGRSSWAELLASRSSGEGERVQGDEEGRRRTPTPPPVSQPLSGPDVKGITLRGSAFTKVTTSQPNSAFSKVTLGGSVARELVSIATAPHDGLLTTTAWADRAQQEMYIPRGVSTAQGRPLVGRVHPQDSTTAALRLQTGTFLPIQPPTLTGPQRPSPDQTAVEGITGSRLLSAPVRETSAGSVSASSSVSSSPCMSGSPLGVPPPPQDAALIARSHSGHVAALTGPHRLSSGSFQPSIQDGFSAAQSLIQGAHEEHLTDITTLCKHEMKLLFAVKTGQQEFPDYLSELHHVLTTKADAIRTLQAKIAKFTQLSEGTRFMNTS